MIPERSYVIALDIPGRMESSEEMAAMIDRLAVEGWSHIAFLIGGALGLHSSLIDSAHMRLSFSPSNFPPSVDAPHTVQNSFIGGLPSSGGNHITIDRSGKEAKGQRPWLPVILRLSSMIILCGNKHPSQDTY